MDTKKVGNFGERIAEKYLRDKGYQILDKNFSFASGLQKGEIDIVAKKGETISFVEVKTLIDASNFSPEEKVNFQKQEKIKKIAQIWLDKNKRALDSKWQIDVLSIKIDPSFKKAKVKHLENIAFD